MRTPDDLQALGLDRTKSCCQDLPNIRVEEGVCTIASCPCEGCCDFNCCDELDYFMHVAYAQAYSNSASGVTTHYGTYEAFFDDWYSEFYAWWNPAGKSVL